MWWPLAVPTGHYSSAMTTIVVSVTSQSAARSARFFCAEFQKSCKFQDASCLGEQIGFKHGDRHLGEMILQFAIHFTPLARPLQFIWTLVNGKIGQNTEFLVIATFIILSRINPFSYNIYNRRTGDLAINIHIVPILQFYELKSAIFALKMQNRASIHHH